MKTKILYITSTGKIYGAEAQLLELCKRLDKKRYDIALCTFKDEGTLLEEAQKLGIKTYSLKIKKKTDIYKLIKLYMIIRKFKPDIIQSFLFFDNIVCRIIGKIASPKTLIISGQRNVETYRSILRNLLDKITIKLTDLVISNTKAGKDILVRNNYLIPKKIKIIYNGKDIRIFTSKSEKDINAKKLKLGYIGSLTEQKGIIYLLRALSYIKQDYITYIIGEGSLFSKLKHYAKKQNINVQFLGYKKDIIPYLNSFDILILPSLWEGMPNVIMEAMACSKPVIATDVGGSPELVINNKTGILVPPKNPKALADAILRLANNKKLREDMGKEGRKRIKQHFSLQKMIKEFDDTYQRLLQK